MLEDYESQNMVDLDHEEDMKGVGAGIYGGQADPLTFISQYLTTFITAGGVETVRRDPSPCTFTLFNRWPALRRSLSL